jgi:septal ring factor EnvC (AmiA/AmiB activator)
MTGMEWGLEALVVVLLAATLVQSVRLERALGVLKRDRAALEALVAEFNASTQQAESAIDRLRATADGAGRQIARHIDTATHLKDDLAFITDRGDRLADRLDALVRAGRPLAAESPRAVAMPDADHPEPQRLRSQAERDLLKALRMVR